MKFSPRNLNPDPYPPNPISTYICEVTIAPKVCGGQSVTILNNVVLNTLINL